MAMFARRELQRAINESLPYASPSMRRKWVGVLNSPSSSNYIPTEWEVLLLRSLSGLGSVTHELDFGGITKPDIEFQSTSLTFVADITAISDHGLHERNPIRRLEEELRKRWLQSGITEGGFAFHASTRLHTGKGAKPPIVVPAVEQFESLLFNERFEQFVLDAKAAPTDQRQLIIPWAQDSVIQITYVPGRKFVWCAGYTSFTLPTQRDRNPLYVALKEKGHQLKLCGYSGLKGVIVCDGGAHVLRNIGGSFAYSVRDIVLHALKRHSSIDFVVIVSLRDRNLKEMRQEVRYELFVRDMTDWAKPLHDVLGKMVERVPMVIQIPTAHVRN